MSLCYTKMIKKSFAISVFIMPEAFCNWINKFGIIRRVITVIKFGTQFLTDKYVNFRCILFLTLIWYAH